MNSCLSNEPLAQNVCFAKSPTVGTKRQWSSRVSRLVVRTSDSSKQQTKDRHTKQPFINIGLLLVTWLSCAHASTKWRPRWSHSSECT